MKCDKRELDDSHCWHVTDKYPAELYIDDNTKEQYKCCWCGKKKTVKYEAIYDWNKEKHGKFRKGTELEE